MRSKKAESFELQKTNTRRRWKGFEDNFFINRVKMFPRKSGNRLMKVEKLMVTLMELMLRWDVLEQTVRFTIL